MVFGTGGGGVKYGQELQHRQQQQMVGVQHDGGVEVGLGMVGGVENLNNR